VRAHHMNEITAGLMTSLLLITQVVGNPLLGWVADKWGCKSAFAIGAVACTFSSMAAWLSNGIGWFYIIFILMGIGSLTYWTIGMTYSLKFGNDSDKPFYVGMSNTLVAPIAILTPLIGGWLADKMGFTTTFMVAAAFGFVTTVLLLVFVRDPSPVASG
jgi:MFS family permease